MGKRQRARERGLSPLLKDYAARTLEVIVDEHMTPVGLDKVIMAQEEAKRVSARHAAPAPPPPTPLEMLVRAVADASRLEFGLGTRAWRKRDGKEAVVYEIKFDKAGNPTYGFQLLQSAARERHHMARVGEFWSPRRVYFLVDENTGRPLAPVG